MGENSEGEAIDTVSCDRTRSTSMKRQKADARQFLLHFHAKEASKDEEFMSDFELMMTNKKKNTINRRVRYNNELTNDYEVRIVELLKTMREAAAQDRQLNLAGKPAITKISLLKQVMEQLIKKNLQQPLLDHNLLDVLAEWISPLPSKALPCLQIRESILKLLGDFPTIEKCYLKQSTIGKAVMYLYKHPEETKTNRKRAGELINAWFRSIYNLQTDLKMMSCEERQLFEMQMIPTNKRKMMKSEAFDSIDQQNLDLFFCDEGKDIPRPGDKKCPTRARIPMLSDKVYVVRPKSKIKVDINPAPKRELNRYAKYLKNFNDHKRKSMKFSGLKLSTGGHNLEP